MRFWFMQESIDSVMDFYMRTRYSNVSFDSVCGDLYFWGEGQT